MGVRGIEELKYCSWRNSSRSVVGKKCRALRGVGGGKSAAAKNRIAGQTMVYRLKGTVRNKKENLLGRGRGGGLEDLSSYYCICMQELLLKYSTEQDR